MVIVENYQNEIDEAPDEEVQELMESHDLDEDTAEQVREVMDEYGVDEDDAVELVEEGL
jgi:division protein CdvB (Snf7/Vps24/ESCRT-III family)